MWLINTQLIFPAKKTREKSFYPGVLIPGFGIYMDKNDELFNFPCDFPIKVIGKAVENLKPVLVDIIRQHCQDIGDITMRTSSGGKYMSVTVNIIAQNRTQLDTLYRELSRHEWVKMVL